MDFKDLNKKLKSKTLGNFNVFIGQEDYLKDFYEKEITDYLLAEHEKTFNLFVFDKDNVNFGELVSIAESYPTFAEHKLLIIKNTDVLASGNTEVNDFLEWIAKDFPPYLYLLLIEREADKRKKAYKLVQTHASMFDMSMLAGADLKGWAQKHFVKAGKRIDSNTLEYFFDACDKNMYCILSETEKLTAYCENEEITKKDIDKIVTKTTENKIFEMVESAVSGNKEKALSLLADLKILKEPEIKILSIISGHIYGLLSTKTMSQKGVPVSEIAKQIGKPDFVIRKYLKQSEGKTVKALKNNLHLCHSLDIGFKTGETAEGYLELEMLISSF